MSVETKYKQPCFKRAYKQVEDYQKRMLKAGRYLPWHDVRSGRQMSSRSITHSLFNLESTHHTLSRGETALFRINETKRRASAIFEQFPLINLKLAYQASVEAGVKYPSDKKHNAYVMTLDQLVEVKDPETGTVWYEAETFKLEQDLRKEEVGERKVKRILEKFKIEAQYFEYLGIPYRIRTERQAPRRHGDNLSCLRQSAYHVHLFADHLDSIIRAVSDAYLERPRDTLEILCKKAANQLGIEFGLCKLAMEFAIWDDRIPYDHTQEFNFLNPLPLRESSDDSQ